MDMQSSIERISPVECRVKVEIPWPEISTRLDTKLADLRRKARLPGFRPGKVPPQVLERMFGKSVRQELAQDLVQETFPDAVSKHEAQPLTQPVVESSSLQSGQPFTYAARFEVRPRIEPKDYIGVPVRRRPTVVEPAKIEAELSSRQEQLTELRPLPEDVGRETTAPGDVWTVDIEGSIGSQRLSRKDVRVDIGDDRNEFIPGLAAALADLRLDEVGKSKQVTFTPPSSRVRPELRDQPAKLSLGLRDVRLKHVPALDDDFARDTGDAETLDELKQKIEADLRTADAEQAEREAQQRLVEELLQRNTFELAPSMIAREVAAQVEQTKRQLAQQGMSLKNLGATEADLRERLRPQAIFNVRAFLLLDAIGDHESISVDDAAFESELEKLAEESGQNVARMRATMEKNGQLFMLRAQLREQKILEFLMSKAEVTEAPDPTEDEAEADAQETT